MMHRSAEPSLLYTCTRAPTDLYSVYNNNMPVQYQEYGITYPAPEQGSGTIKLHTLHLNRVLVLSQCMT